MNRAFNFRWNYILAGLLSLLVGVSILTRDLPVIISHFIVDDSFYYFEIARNIAHGHGATFDNIHRTNGFQPLFQVLIVPVFWLTDDPETGIYFIKGLEVLFLCAIGFLLFHLVEKISQSDVAPWVSLLLLFFPGPSGLPFAKDLMIGMESGINALMLLILLHFWMRAEEAPAASPFFYFTYGSVIGLAFLARLDNIFLIPGIAIWHFVQLYKSNERGRLFSRLALAGTVSFVIAGIYLWWNLSNFGHIVPISGRIQAWYSGQMTRDLLAQGIFPWLQNTFWFITRPKAVALLPIAGILLIPILLWIEKQNNGGMGLVSRYRSMFLVIWVCSVLKIFYYAVFEQYPHSGRYWYYVGEALMLVLVFGMLVAHLGRKFFPGDLRRPVRVAAILGMILSAGLVTQIKPVFEWEMASYMVLDEIAARTNPDDVIGVEDAGLLGYFLPNPVVNLDGLVNDEEFFRYLQEGRLEDYARKEDIRYLTNLLVPGPEDDFTRSFGRENLHLLYAAPNELSYRGSIYKIYEFAPSIH